MALLETVVLVVVCGLFAYGARRAGKLLDEAEQDPDAAARDPDAAAQDVDAVIIPTSVGGRRARARYRAGVAWVAGIVISTGIAFAQVKRIPARLAGFFAPTPTPEPGPDDAGAPPPKDSSLDAGAPPRKDSSLDAGGADASSAHHGEKTQATDVGRASVESTSSGEGPDLLSGISNPQPREPGR